MIWGPYRSLRPGRYFFEPRVEFAHDSPIGAVMVDVALDMVSVAQRMLPTVEGSPRLPFVVEKQAAFEFRIWATQDHPPPDFSFFGGRLVRQGASSVLHQAEYMRLLIELVHMRFEDGVLENVGG